MDSADVIVVGSGAAGTWAARQLRPAKVMVIDVGITGQRGALDGNFYDLRRGSGASEQVLFEELIGNRFESLVNVFGGFMSPKLKAPRMRFVTERAADLSAVDAAGFDATMSFAKGGLANAWGAGVYRYTDRDLAGFPIGAEDLNSYYDVLTREIGISGAEDDLSPYFGDATGLLPPLDLDRSGSALLRRYERRRSALRRKGLSLGRPRLAVLSRDHRGREAYRYHALDFFQPLDPAVYTPAYTLDEMVRAGEVTYEPGLLVERFVDLGNEVVVTARQTETGAPRELRCRRLLLAAGALNTAKIVLRSFDDCDSRLPLLDNGVSYVPLLDLSRIGAELEPKVFPAAMLNAIYDGPLAPQPVQMTLYGLAGTLRSDFLFDFPLSLRGNLVAARSLTPAMVLAQLFYPDTATPANYVRLQPGGGLEMRYQSAARGSLERYLLKLFRRLGCVGWPALNRELVAGSSLHYAGMLPMRQRPASRYETDVEGRLGGTGNVHVVDAANFSALPAKNHTFTIMANAMRIAERVGRSLS